MGLTLALHAFGSALYLSARGVHTPGDKNLSLGAAGFFLAYVAFPLVGAIIVTRRHFNAIGWLFLLLGVAFAVDDAAGSYADYAVFAHPGSLPGGPWAGWLAGLLDPFVFASIMLVLLLFPDGRFPSRRWRPAAWLVLTFAVLSVLWNGLKPDKIFSDTLPIENPAGIAWLGQHLAFLDQLIFVLFLAGIGLSVAAAAVRFRRSRAIERDRMKWLAFAVLLLVVALVVAMVAGLAGATQLGDFAIGCGIAGVPIAVGIGVLRYRLYEIDRVISRTLSFAVVTACLGAAYVALVLLGQSLFSSVAGGGGLAVAVSTLVVAALFLPVRARVQRIVDRRFNRRRYDAERTLEAFGARLRDQVELEALTAELAAVVGETMQPAHAGIWLRETAR